MTAPSHDRITTATWQIRQLVEPIAIRVKGENREHPALLDQLREAVTAGQSTATRETIRRRHRESQPPYYNEAAAATLSGIYVDISAWHARLGLPSPDRALDWQQAALRQLNAALRQLNDEVLVNPTDRPGLQFGWYPMVVVHLLIASIADDLAHTIDQWWESAARATGWRLRDLRPR